MVSRPFDWLKCLGRCVLAILPLVASATLYPALAQGLSISPINVVMEAGQLAAVVDLGNQGERELSFQIRSYAWRQAQGDDQLAPTDELAASPPLGTIAPHATQVVRIVLRRPPQGREATYRILVDELPPPSTAGNVRVAIRLSIPIFAAPQDRVSPQVKWRVTSQGGQTWLVATNAGTRHLSVRNIRLHTTDGRDLQVETKQPPHILPAGARRWLVLARGATPRPGSMLRLTADADLGAVDEQVRVDAGP